MAKGGARGGGDGENTKKKPSAAAKKAEKQQTADKQQKAAIEEEEWSKGTKSNAKKEAEAERKAEAARKKAEKDAILAAEEKEAKAAPKASKSAPKKTVSKALDLSQLDAAPEAASSKSAPALAATGIDNALDALSLTAQDGTKIDKHPERRFKAAFAAYQERRMKEMDEDGSGQGLRKNQKEAQIRKEFEKSEENPFNQVSARYDASKEEVRELKAAEKSKIESRLAEK